MLLLGIIALVWAALIGLALVLLRAAGRADRQAERLSRRSDEPAEDSSQAV